MTKTFLRIDETPTEKENERIVADDPALLGHIELIHSAFDLLPVVIRYVTHKDDCELVFSQLAIRLFNSAASALKLARSGYYQQALSLIRDVIEIQFLLDLFRRDPKELSLWVKLPGKERASKFKPVRVREKLDKLDGFKEQQRGSVYKLFSEFAAHPTPNGFRIISPDGMTQMGAFPSKKQLTACIEELAKHFPFACYLFSSRIESDDMEVLEKKAHFLETLTKWKERHYGSMGGKIVGEERAEAP